jgi:hypothetical protein
LIDEEDRILTLLDKLSEDSTLVEKYFKDKRPKSEENKDNGESEREKPVLLPPSIILTPRQSQNAGLTTGCLPYLTRCSNNKTLPEITLLSKFTPK